MDDIDELFDIIEEPYIGFLEIEDITEDIFDPEEFLEELIEDTIKVISAIIAFIMIVIFTILLVIFGIISLILGSFTETILLLLFITGLVGFLSFILFLYVRTNLPNHIESKINEAIEESEDEPKQSEEKEKIELLKEKYINNEITEEELEKRIDKILNNQKDKNKTYSYNK